MVTSPTYGLRGRAWQPEVVTDPQHGDPGSLLTAERAELVERLAALRADVDGVHAASRDSNADDEHDPEGATIAFERSQLHALARAARLRLDEVDAALVRLAEGSYGRCRTCGEPIAPGRLVARPAARTCLAHA